MIAVLRGGLDITSAPALREKLLGLLRPGASRLIVDLSSVEYADASGFAVLVGAARRARLLGGWLRLASPTPGVARILSATGLDRHLATFPTVADAITGRRPDVGTAEAETGVAGHVAPIRPVAALAARYFAGRIYFGKWVGRRREWFFEQVKDRPMGGVPKWLRQPLKLVPDSVRVANDPVIH